MSHVHKYVIVYIHVYICTDISLFNIYVHISYPMPISIDCTIREACEDGERKAELLFEVQAIDDGLDHVAVMGEEGC